jgi:signal transduction histidine kinase
LAETVSASQPPAADLRERVALQHLLLVRTQVLRMPIAYIAIEVFIVWLLARLGFLMEGMVWFLLVILALAWRWRYVKTSISSPSEDAEAELGQLGWMLMSLAILRAAVVPLVFSRPIAAEHYMLTMVYLGMAAGAVATAGGVLKHYLLWAGIAGGSLSLAWVLDGRLDSAWLGILVVALLAVLAGHVRDQGKSLQQLVRFAHDNELLAASLRTERDRAESANQSKTRFFAAASHDLRQPLHALSINATTLELLARRQADPLIKDLSHSINRALAQSNSLLEGLLDVSKLDANAIQPNFQTIDSQILLDRVRDEFSALAAQRGLRLVLRVEGDGPFQVSSDPDQLVRILNNVVGNALKFTQVGQVELLLRPDPDVPERVCLSVIDSGPGIAPAEQERVFEEFYQIGNASRDRSHGLGLGLAIVRRTAKLLGIEVRLSSQLGCGTQVDLFVRRALGESASASIEEAVTWSLDAPLGLTVLVVDDEPDGRNSISGLLKQLGCQVRCAEGLDEAVSLVKEGFRPDVVVSDYRLRGHTGREVIAATTAILGATPALIVTGDTAPRTIQDALSGGYPVLHKPVPGPLLVRALREVTKR